MIENEPRTWPQSSRTIPDNQNIGVAFMSPLVMPLLSRPCNPVNYRAGTGATCKQQEKNRRPGKGENLQRAFVIYLDGLTKSESRRPPNRPITGPTTGVFILLAPLLVLGFGVRRVRAMKNPARFPGPGLGTLLKDIFLYMGPVSTSRSHKLLRSHKLHHAKVVFGIPKTSGPHAEPGASRARSIILAACASAT